MSRTIRRTIGRNKHGVLLPTHNYWVWPYDPPEDNGWRSCKQMTPEQAKAWEIARFHRDHRSGQFGVPRWFRNRFNRDDRHDQRHEIRRCLNQGDFDDFLVIDPPDNAGWYWW